VKHPNSNCGPVCLGCARQGGIDEVKKQLEKAVKDFDDLERQYPGGGYKVKADTLWRFAEVFLE